MYRILYGTCIIYYRKTTWSKLNSPGAKRPTCWCPMTMMAPHTTPSSRGSSPRYSAKMVVCRASCVTSGFVHREIRPRTNTSLVPLLHTHLRYVSCRSLSCNNVLVGNFSEKARRGEKSRGKPVVNPASRPGQESFKHEGRTGRGPPQQHTLAGEIKNNSPPYLHNVVYVCVHYRTAHYYCSRTFVKSLPFLVLRLYLFSRLYLKTVLTTACPPHAPNICSRTLNLLLSRSLVLRMYPNSATLPENRARTSQPYLQNALTPASPPAAP